MLQILFYNFAPKCAKLHLKRSSFILGIGNGLESNSWAESDVMEMVLFEIGGGARQSEDSQVPSVPLGEARHAAESAATINIVAQAGNT